MMRSLAFPMDDCWPALSQRWRPPARFLLRWYRSSARSGSDNPFIDGPELVRRFAQIYGGDFRYLPVPLLVDEVRTRNALLAVSTDFRDLSDLARRANTILMGIGTLEPGYSSQIVGGNIC